MTKPIIGAMAAALVCLTGTPGQAKADQKAPPPREPSRLVEVADGFAICTCGSPCSETAKTRPEPIRVGANVRLDATLIAAGSQPRAKESSDARQ
ncbi:hypothetical protein L6Q21_10045 [Sandaracinobacter sp. RS1-74]|uniref:hypothetical protein n=1 Tax=Sandaracinobacteroides sayramensis TaxID=2913411 RepID=UPI001EDC7FF5|nr:hypothetical protein [Sandaracinobacteroides sayramensis]MCG2841322.1 hypothetical protein [Sandaracinobacteroides sayramensis]